MNSLLKQDGCCLKTNEFWIKNDETLIANDVLMYSVEQNVVGRDGRWHSRARQQASGAVEAQRGGSILAGGQQQGAVRGDGRQVREISYQNR